MRIITCFSNPLVKRVKSLRDKKHRKREGLFLAEGLRIVTEAREAGFLPEILFHGPDAADQPLARAAIDATRKAGGEVVATTPDILSKLSGKDNPQTLIAAFVERPTALGLLDRNAAPIWLVAERLRDPGNLGTMLRTADAVGAGGLILLDECVDPFSVEAIRASMGAIFTVALAQATSAGFLAWLRSGPGQLVGLSLDTDTDYLGARYAPPVFVLTGNEARGMPPELASACDTLVRIPMLGRADSLNAAIATAVMAYAVRARIG